MSEEREPPRKFLGGAGGRSPCTGNSGGVRLAGPFQGAPWKFSTNTSDRINKNAAIIATRSNSASDDHISTHNNTTHRVAGATNNNSHNNNHNTTIINNNDDGGGGDNNNGTATHINGDNTNGNNRSDVGGDANINHINHAPIAWARGNAL